MSTQITAAGLETDSATDIKGQLDTGFKGIFGNQIGTEADQSVPPATSIGQEIALITDAISGNAEALQSLYAAFDPDQAVAPQLDILCAITGTRRKNASASIVWEILRGTASTLIPQSSVLTVTGTGERFALYGASLAARGGVTLAAPSATWAASTDYEVGQFVKTGGRCYVCITAGTTGLVAPSGTSTDLPGQGANNYTDGSVHWAYLGADTIGIAYAPFEAESTGPIQANAGALVTIATPVAGWTFAYNLADTATDPNTTGRDEETDASLRARRLEELQALGGGPADSIRAYILAQTGVIGCSVYVNDDDIAAVIDGITLPPHSVDVLVDASGLADETIALYVWKAVGAGIKTSGNVPNIAITDASGNQQLVSFSRPEDVAMWVRASIRFDANVWSSSTADTDVKNAVRAALRNWAFAYPMGVNFRATPVASAIMKGPYAVDSGGSAILPAPAGSPSIPGLYEVRNYDDDDGTLPWIGKVADGAPTTSTAVELTARQRASLAEADITLVASSEEP